MEFVLFVAGLMLGAVGIGAYARRTRSALLARDPGQSDRPQVLAPVAVLLGDEGRDLPMTDRGFAALAQERLEDARVQHGAAAAATWRFRAGQLELDLVAGNREYVREHEPALMPLLEWTARVGVTQFGPDGDAPKAGVAPLGGRDGRHAGALALLFAEPVPAPRDQLKNWLQRHGQRVGITSELVRTHDELAKTNKRTRMLLRETQNWDVEERPSELGLRLCALVEQLTGADGAALIRWDDDLYRGSVAVADGTCARYAGSTVDEDSLAGTACRENVPQIWHEVSGRGEGPEALFSRSLPTQTGCVLVQPLRRRGKVIGAVVAAHSRPGALGAAELRALSLFDAVASFRLASAWKLEEVSRRALEDGLTGLTNREGFEIEMRNAHNEHLRYGWEISLVIVDVDHFKLVNDTHGHEVGDAVLRAIARTLDDGVRGTDVCARVGGEEMALILKDTDFDGAMELAERLRVAIESMRMQFGTDEVRQTASFGVATFPTHVKDWTALYRKADRALYDAKAAGRNQVMGAAPE